MKSNLFTLVFFLFASTVFSQVFVKQDATGNNDGTSWDNAYVSLVTALANAESDSEIWVANGLYRAGDAGSNPESTFFVVNDLLSLYGGFAGTETSIAERDILANETILNGDLNGDDIPDDFVTNRADNGRHVLLLNSGFFGTVVVDGFTIENGSANYGEAPMGAEPTLWFGGGILSLAEAEIKNCTFRQNGGSLGSAMISLGSATMGVESCLFENNDSEVGTLLMLNHFNAEVSGCEFVSNQALSFGAGMTLGNANATISGCDFISNVVTEGLGAGLMIFQDNENPIPSPLVSVLDCNFLANSAPIGGGLANNSAHPDASLVLIGCDFDENVASDAGAGLLVQNLDDDIGTTSLNFSMTDCAFFENSLTSPNGNGAAAAIASGAYDLTFNLDSCYFVDNIGKNSSGGLYVLNGGSSDMTGNISNTVFEGNTVDVFGGGAYISNDNPNSTPQFSLTNCFFDENSSDGFGGGLVIGSSSTGAIPGPNAILQNCGFEDNSATGAGGGFVSFGSSFSMSESYFAGNTTLGDIAGGGALFVSENSESNLDRSFFADNHSSTEGSAIMLLGNEIGTMDLDNVLLSGNIGNSCIYAEDEIKLRNVTMAINEGGLYQVGTSHLTMQNSLFVANNGNYTSEGSPTVTTLGGNLSDDASTSSFLIGSGGFPDFNEADPLLDSDLVPTMDSPCVDAGNPVGIPLGAIDIKGEPRIQGSNVDIGALESPFMVSPVFENKFAGSVQVYPNPFSDIIQVEASETPTELRLFNANGKLVEVFSKPTGLLNIDESIATGVYFLELHFESGTAKKMLVKK